MSAVLQPVRCSIAVAARPTDAFNGFVDGIGRWWPLAYTYSGDQFETAAIEPHAGGRWFERGLDGVETTWGTVRAFEPERRLVVSWGVSPKRTPEPSGKESEVEIRFVQASGGTRVELEHRDFERHGEGARQLREGMASRQGWPLILACFAREMRYAA